MSGIIVTVYIIDLSCVECEFAIKLPGSQISTLISLKMSNMPQKANFYLENNKSLDTLPKFTTQFSI